MTNPGWFVAPGDPWRDTADDVLLARAAGGDAGAVDAFVARFSDRLGSYLLRLVRDRAWTDDLVQEALVRALRDAARYDAAWPVAVWLFRIGRNLALDLLRREGAHRLRVARLAGQAADTAPAAITTAEHREFQRALEAALQRLPESFRSVFLLREREGLDYEQIGQVLGISAKTVSSRLHRARSQLRHWLREPFAR